MSRPKGEISSLLPGLPPLRRTSGVAFLGADRLAIVSGALLTLGSPILAASVVKSSGAVASQLVGGSGLDIRVRCGVGGRFFAGGQAFGRHVQGASGDVGAVGEGGVGPSYFVFGDGCIDVGSVVDFDSCCSDGSGGVQCAVGGPHVDLGAVGSGVFNDQCAVDVGGRGDGDVGACVGSVMAEWLR